MVTAEHLDDCPHITARPPRSMIPRYDAEGYIEAMVLNPEAWDWKPPPCDGCISDADRALWQRLADEADAYLDREPEETLL